MTDETEPCGYVKGDGEPCELPGSRSDGRCHHHTDIDEKRRPGGRPRMLEEDDDLYGKIMDAAERGLTYEGIARVAGIGLSTLNDWRDEYAEFASDLERKRAVGEQKLVERVAEDRPEFILERSYDYIKTEKREIEGEHEHRIEGDGFVVEFGDE